MALITLGGSLKRREMLSAKMGDVLSELYMLSAALKRFEDEVLANIPSRPAAWLVRFVALPGGSNRGLSDQLIRECARPKERSRE